MNISGTQSDTSIVHSIVNVLESERHATPDLLVSDSLTFLGGKAHSQGSDTRSMNIDALANESIVAELVPNFAPQKALEAFQSLKSAP
jgi:hypothetical protein